jgi:hypothetical protein
MTPSDRYQLPPGFFTNDARDKRAASRAMDGNLVNDPDINPTVLAENAAHALEHDEWLDDETHWIWELSLSKVSAD